MSGVYVFTGENAFALDAERQRWIAEFSSKHGPENLTVLEGKKTRLTELLNEVSAAPFIAPKRLVVVDGMPKIAREEVEILLRSKHEDVLLVVCDAKPDKRLAATKDLLAKAEVRTFDPLKGSALQRWVVDIAKGQGVSVDAAAVDMLLDYVGDNQALLMQELNKLVLANVSGSMTKQDIERHVVPTFEGAVWKLTDLLATNKSREALRYASRLTSRGGDPFGTWAMLLSGLKNITAIHMHASAGMNKKEIAATAGLHPFAVQSLLPKAHSLNKKRLITFIQWATDTDRALKTGGLRATSEQPEELQAAIDSFVLRFP